MPRYPTTSEKCLSCKHYDSQTKECIGNGHKCLWLQDMYEADA